jgi:membrane-associated protease RseP (regulator of RpoE activity)
MDKYFGYIIDILIIFPIVTIIHEIGHTIAVKMFGGKISSVKFGIGPKLVKLGILQVNRYYFWGGNFSYSELQNGSILKQIIIMFSGPLLNFVTFILFIFISVNIEQSFFIDGLIKFSLICSIVNLIPFSFEKSNTDGKQILDLIVRGESYRFKTRN